jgi:hypothetical protein
MPEEQDHMPTESFIARGELNGKSKLTAAEVIELRQRYARRYEIGQRVTIRQLAKRFGISAFHCWRILHREVWRHV